MNDLEHLTRLCESLGAPAAQARTMAAQLLRRADQLVAERGISRVDALRGLLDVLVQGRGGKVPDWFGPPAGPPEPRAPG